jgi:phosphatidylglycerophosphate synthase
MRKLTFKNFNIADWFSFYRIGISPVLVLLILTEERHLFTWMLLISYTTDMVDGFLARSLKITSARGSQLDSMGDQITFLLGLAGIFVFEYDFILHYYPWISIGFGLYIVQMILAWRKYGKATAFHTYLAKSSALVQGIFILWLLFFGPVLWLFFFMIALGILETIEEIMLIYFYDHWHSDIKGLYWALKDKKIRTSGHH